MTQPNKLLEMINARRAQASRQKTIKPEAGRNRYRILPSWRGEGEQFWMDFGQHFIKDASNKVLAVYVCAEKTFGRPCEVCSAIENGIRHAEDDMTIKQLGDAKSNGRVLLNVLWLNNGGKCPENEPQVLEVAPSVLQGKKGVGGILALFDEWPNLLDLATGCDIIVEKSGTGKDTAYGVQVAGQSKPVPADVMKKLHDLDKFVHQENEQAQARALTSLGTIAGRPVALPAPTPGPIAAAGAVIPSQDDQLRALEGVSTRVIDPAAVVATPAPVAQQVVPPVQQAAPAAAPAPAPQPQPAAPAPAAGGDELDDLLKSLG